MTLPPGSVVSIPTVLVKSSKGDDSVGVYLIITKLAGTEQEVRVERRFNDFNAMHQNLPDSVTQDLQLPGKKWFGNLKATFLDDRKTQLEKYLQAILLKLEGNEALQNNRLLIGFLGIVDEASFTADYAHVRGYGGFSIQFGNELGTQVSRGHVLGITMSGKVDDEVANRLVTELVALTFDYQRVNLLCDVEAVESGETALVKVLFEKCKKIRRCALISPSSIKKVLVAIDGPFAKLFAGVEEKMFEPKQKEEAWKWVMQGMETIQMKTSDPFLYKYSGQERLGKEMRVLIIGGGPAGMTLCAQLANRGFKPKLIEIRQPTGHRGFVLGLMPTTLRLLASLTRIEDGENLKRYLTTHCGNWGTYQLINEKGKTLGRFSFQKLLDRHGPGALKERGELCDLIASCIPKEYIHYGKTIKDLQQDNNEVTVTYDDDQTELFDLVVACDGIHSRTRRMVFGTVEERYLGASGWSFKLPADILAIDPLDLCECWSHKRFVGVYPTGNPNESYIYAGVVQPPNLDDPVETRIPRLLEKFKGMGGDLFVPVWEYLRTQVNPDNIFHDDLNDIYNSSWSCGRVVLCGDSAHAILPTGGVGASMAMESATVLAEELARSDSKTICDAFRNYEARRRGRVDRIQSASHTLGKWAVGDVAAPLTTLRDFAATFFSEEDVVGFFEQNLNEPI